MSKAFSHKIDMDSEVKQCNIVRPFEALQSDFAKKLLEHLVWNSKYKEQYLKDIISKLDDETQTLTSEEWKSFLDFMK